ncbi:hypothetical protein BDY24DRAFT_443965 [Mrakia frigida]|uniref:uncharacterized protein n=1 Tax=Mrakia frigida TaxID=29902 RepID=UPI003FCBF0EE
MAPPIALSRVLGRRASSSSSSSSSASTSRIRAQGPPPPPSLPSSTPPSPPPDSPSAFIVQPTKEKKRIVVTETKLSYTLLATREALAFSPFFDPGVKTSAGAQPYTQVVNIFYTIPFYSSDTTKTSPGLLQKRRSLQSSTSSSSSLDTRQASRSELPRGPGPPASTSINRSNSPETTSLGYRISGGEEAESRAPFLSLLPSFNALGFGGRRPRYETYTSADISNRTDTISSPSCSTTTTTTSSSARPFNSVHALREPPVRNQSSSSSSPSSTSFSKTSREENKPGLVERSRPPEISTPSGTILHPAAVETETHDEHGPNSLSSPQPTSKTRRTTKARSSSGGRHSTDLISSSIKISSSAILPHLDANVLSPTSSVTPPTSFQATAGPGPTNRRTTVSSSSFKPSPSYSISSPPPLPRIVQAKVDGELNAKSTPPPPSPSPRVDVFRPPPSRQGPPIRPPPPYLTPMPRHTTAPRTRLPISPPRPSLRPSRVDANTSVPSFLLRGPSPNKLEDEDEHWTLETVGSTPDFDPPSFNLDNVAQIPPPISQLSPFKAPSNPTVSTSFYAWTPSEDPTLISSQKYVNWSPSELPLLQTYVSLPTPPFSFDDLASIPFSHISEGEFFAIRSFILDNGDPSVVGREDWAFWKANEDEKTALLEMVSREKWAFPPASDWELTQARRGWFDSMRWSEKGQEQWNRMLVLARFRQNVEKQGSQSTPSESVAYWKDSEVLALRTDLQSHGFQAVVTKHVSDLLPFDPHHSDLEWFMLEARFKNAFEASFRPSSSILSESEKVRLLRVAKVLGEASSWSGGKRRIWRMGDQARRAWGQMSSFASLGEDLERSRMEKRLARKQKRRLERTAEKTASKQSYQDLTTPFTSSGPSSSRSPADIPPPFDSQPGMKSPFSNLSFHDYRRALPRLVRPSHRSDVRPKMPIASPLRRPPSFLTAAPPRHIPNRSIPPPESILSNNPFRTGRVQTRLLPPPPPPRPLRQASGSTRSPFSTKHSLANHPPPSPKTKRTFPFSFFDQHTRLESPFSHYNSLATSPPPPVSSSRRSPAIKNTTRFKSPLVHRPKPSPHNSNSNRVPLPLPSRTSTVYPPFPPKASLLIYNHLIAIRSSRSGLPIPTRPVPTSTRFLLPEHPTFLLDLQTETEAYWSFHAQKDGIFLDPKRKDMYLEYLRSTARRAGSKERIGTTSLRQEANASFAVLGWTPEERFRVYCSWGKGKRWLEEVIARKKAKQGAVVVEEEKVGEESVSVNEEEVASTRVKFLAAREEVRNEEPMAGFSARFLAAREEARLVEEEEREEREREREREKDEKEEALAAERRNRRSFRSGSGS